MTYSILLFDFDHTLFDSDASEAAAFARTLCEFGIEDPDSHFDDYKTINRTLWSAVEQGHIKANEVRTTRFERLTAEIGLDADPGAMADTFGHAMGVSGDLYPGTRPVLEQLAASATLAMVTNALSEIQRTRIERLDIDQYFDTIVISEEVGTSKPGTTIFDITFEQLENPAKDAALMIGDSLTSDIKGGSSYGLATCWYNPHGKCAGPDDQITHEITAMDQLLSLVSSV
jgi:YjjG family noncanonical pyrimidine nucleotidase